MPRLSHIAVHPIKALDPVEMERVAVTDIGGLNGDRAYAIVDGTGEYINGKRTAAVHRLRADVDLESKRVTFRVEGTGSEREFHLDATTERTFHLDTDQDAIEAWLSNYFEVPVTLEAGPGGSRTDGVVYGDESRAGPTVTTEATLREVASWYDGINPTEMRLRLRPNLVIEGTPPFWEDRLLADGGRRVRVGDVELEGTRPISRCVVPTRDPHTGEPCERFRETFIERRAATLPAWTDRELLDDNLYSLTVGTRISDAERDGELRVGSEVELL